MTINITLNNVADLTQTTTAQTTINNNSATITTGFVSAYNTTGDQLQGTMDVNSNQLINLPSPATANSPVRLQDLSTITGGGTVSNLPVGGTTGQSLLKTSNANFVTGWGNPSITGSQVTSGTIAGSFQAAVSLAAGNVNGGVFGLLPVVNGGTGVNTVPQIQTLLGQTLVTYVMTGVNFNSANTDNAFTITLPTGFTNYLIQYIRISNASASLSTSTFGVFTGAGGTGTQIVATGTACTVTSASTNTVNNAQNPATTNVGPTQSINYGTLFFRVQTPQGSAATATVSVAVLPLS